MKPKLSNFLIAKTTVTSRQYIVDIEDWPVSGIWDTLNYIEEFTTKHGTPMTGTFNGETVNVTY